MLIVTSKTASLIRPPAPDGWHLPGNSRIYRPDYDPSRMPPKVPSRGKLEIPTPYPRLATSWALVNKATIVGGSSGGTTSGFTTTGANLIVVVAGSYNGVSFIPTPTDNKGNTYTQRYLNPDEIAIFDCWNPTVGTGHTVTVSAAALYPYVCVLAFSGADPGSDAFDQKKVGSALGAGTSQNPGAFTPSNNGQLIVGQVGVFVTDHGVPLSISGGGLTWHVEQDVVYSAGNNIGGGVGWAVQPTAASITVTFSWANSEWPSVGCATYRGDGSSTSVRKKQGYFF